MGSFKAGRFGDYGDVGIISNSQWVEDDAEMRQAGNTAWDFAASRRLNGAGLAKSCDSASAMGRTWNLTGHAMVKIITLPLQEIAFGASGQMRVHVLLERDIDEPILVGADLDGGNGARKLMTATAGTKELVTLNFGMDPQRSANFKGTPALNIYLISRNASASTAVTIHSISAFEPQNLPLRPKVFRDTTGATNVIGAANQPLSAFVRTLVANQQRVLHWARAAKSNIITQCFTSGYLVGAGSYATDKDRLGRWFVRKPYGGTGVTLVTQIDVSVGNANIQASMYSLATLDYDGEVSAFTAGDILEDHTSGARARIVKVTDSGTTGTLFLSYVTGTFANNDSLKGRNSTTGAARGEALQNGAIRAGELVDSDVIAVPIGSLNYPAFSLDTVDEDAEYEIRLDAEKDGATATTVESFFVTAYVNNSATTIEHRLPRSSWCEQDDPIRASTYKSIKDTQNATWHNQRAIVLNDSRARDWTKKQRGRTDISEAAISRYNFGTGILYKASRSRALKARIVVSKRPISNLKKISFTGGSGTRVIEDIMTGATSGAVARVEYISSGATGFVYLLDDGNFLNGEALSTAGGWSGTASSAPTPFEAQQHLRLAVFHTYDTPIAEHTVDLSTMPRGSAQTIDLVVNLASDLYDNDSSVVVYYPLVWTIQAWTTVPGDSLMLEQYQVFQAPLTTLDAELYEDEQ